MHIDKLNEGHKFQTSAESEHYPWSLRLTVPVNNCPQRDKSCHQTKHVKSYIYCIMYNLAPKTSWRGSSGRHKRQVFMYVIINYIKEPHTDITFSSLCPVEVRGMLSHKVNDLPVDNG